MSVDLSGSIYTLYKDARLKGDQAKQRAAYEQAGKHYAAAARWMRAYADHTQDAGVRKERLTRAEKLMEAARGLNKQAGKTSPTPIKTDDKPPVRQSETPVGEDDYEEEVLSLIHKSDVRWRDIGGLEDTKESIKSAYALALAQKPPGVQVSSWRNLLMYGPPGTGKTLLAAATAGNLEATFFNVKVSSLLSKYFGESTRLISALFSVARRLSPAVIFLDEFESLTPTRGSGESGAERRIVSTLLAELDGLQAKDDTGFVLTICATNLPWLLDLAILSRFQRRIYVPLPDPEARRSIFDIQLTQRGHTSLLSMEALVEQTDGFAGREIEQLCLIAINVMIRRANPELLKLVDRGLAQIQAYQLNVQPLAQEDFRQAFDQIKPIADPSLCQRYEDWQSSVLDGSGKPR
jgi:katanin p60 ATPase-containing subunit A1